MGSLGVGRPLHQELRPSLLLRRERIERRGGVSASVLTELLDRCLLFKLSKIHLADGRSHSLDALFIGPHHHLNDASVEQTGCAIEEGPLGPMIKVDEMQMTRVPNVFAAGDITRIAHNVTFPCADGVMAPMAIHRSLAFEAAA